MLDVGCWRRPKAAIETSTEAVAEVDITSDGHVETPGQNVVGFYNFRQAKRPMSWPLVDTSEASLVVR